MGNIRFIFEVVFGREEEIGRIIKKERKGIDSG